MTQSSDKNLKLQTLAREQGGLFTASQAAELGFDNANQHRFVKDGRWQRLRRGIFRLQGEPEGELSDIQEIALFLRTRGGKPGGVFGLETAAVIHGIGDFMPGTITVLVPPSFRRRAELPTGVDFIKTEDLERGVERRGALFLTTPIRTIVDLLKAPDRDKEETRRGFVAARRAGIITKKALLELDQLTDADTSSTIMQWEYESVTGEQ